MVVVPGEDCRRRGGGMKEKEEWKKKTCPFSWLKKWNTDYLLCDPRTHPWFRLHYSAASFQLCHLTRDLISSSGAVTFCPSQSSSRHYSKNFLLHFEIKPKLLGCNVNMPKKGNSSAQYNSRERSFLSLFLSEWKQQNKTEKKRIKWFKGSWWLYCLNSSS